MKNENTDFEVRSLDAICVNESKKMETTRDYLKYITIGVIFGIVFVKGEVISWFRIQEMFRFQSFHMYGIIGTAVIVGTISIFIIKKFQLKTIDGEDIEFQDKSLNKGQIIGGILFGCGWAMTGACPGPLYALIGNGATVLIVSLLSAIGGTWVYGWMREKLPH